ncbi:MAG: IS1 family transposase [Acidobacteria bacterium]|nr:IS1 family transposase [Acidobacteriota bacterium]
MTGADKKTITRLLVRVGEGCAGMMDDRMRDLDCYNLQIDEVWSYVGKKQGRLSDDERREGMKGDQYVFVALDADTKLVPSWRVGPRNMDTTLAFMRDLDSRLRCRPQITTDGFSPYQLAVPFVFSGNVDFATEVKTYTHEDAGRGRYAPPRVSASNVTVQWGDPAPEGISTSFVERSNLTLRMHSRRFTRLTNAYSKSLRNLKAAVGLHFAWYNFVRIHRTLRVTPAMEAGVTGRLYCSAR